MDNEARLMVTKRIYDEPADDDGFRVLVDRLWPCGITRQRVTLLYGARDPEVNHARVLLEFLQR
jgi:uncharacterized protein YeaO (DUF488 family)